MKIHVGDELEPDKPSKTEVLFVTRPSKMYQNPSTYDATDLSNINIGDHCHFPIVDKFCYLGSIISRDCKDTLDLIHRIRKAGNAFGALKRSIFSSRRISDSAKSSAYQSLILPILLYCIVLYSILLYAADLFDVNKIGTCFWSNAFFKQNGDLYKIKNIIKLNQNQPNSSKTIV